jgi:hypothetical protein
MPKSRLDTFKELNLYFILIFDLLTYSLLK